MRLLSGESPSYHIEHMGFETGQAREQIDRLLRSNLFAASTTHRRLLEYLAEKSLSGEADHLKEYTIGIEAFGKPESYDPRADSIVRQQVGRLRQKLIEYYQAEGNTDPVAVTLPKGRFRLAFDLKRPEQASSVRKWRALSLTLAAALVLALLLAVYAWRARFSAPGGAWSADLEILWKPFLGSSRPLVICMGTPLFVAFPDDGYYREHTLNEWDEAIRAPQVVGIGKMLGGLQPRPWHNFTLVGEAHAVFSLSRLLGPRRADLSLVRSHDFAWEQIATHNVVFVGPPKSNRQLDELPMEPEFAIKKYWIRNLKPRPGEPDKYRTTRPTGKVTEGEAHALITLTTGLNGKGSILVVAGNTGADTQAAAEWVTDRVHAAELVSRLRQPNGNLPEAFQIVLRVRFKDLVPVESSWVTHRVLKKRPPGQPQ